jgi:hypothetical protein
MLGTHARVLVTMLKATVSNNIRIREESSAPLVGMASPWKDQLKEQPWPLVGPWICSGRAFGLVKCLLISHVKVAKDGDTVTENATAVTKRSYTNILAPAFIGSSASN